MPYDCFISYASADVRLAEGVYHRLRAEGFTVWFDKVRLQPGYDWHREIEDGCENSRVFLPILTPRWKESDWTKFETYGAEALLPLVFEGAWEQVCTPPLERFQAERLDRAALDGGSGEPLFAALRRALAQAGPLKQRHIAHLPSLTNPFFTGREGALVALHEQLHTRPRASLSQGRVRAIAANGGVGKTTLVRHYAEKYWRCYPQMFWVDARLGFEAEFARIHDWLFPAEAAAGYKDADKAVRAFQALEGREARLLILDNVEDEASARRWIPKTGGCHTLITSRFAGWPASIETFHLYVLKAEPSVRFLQDRIGRSVSGPELQACETLAGKVGYLPLALEQAAAYIEQQGDGFGFVDYLRLYEQAAAKLLSARPPGDYPDSVMTTWSSTMSQLSAGARALLRMGAFMESAPIPVGLLIGAAGAVESLAGETPPAQAGAGAADAELYIRSALADLKRYSMAQYNGKTVQIHSLLQFVVRVSLSAAEGPVWWKAAVAALVSVARGHGFARQLRPEWKDLLPHAEKLQENRSGLPIADPSTELAEILRDCYYSQGRYDQALPFAEMVYQEDRREFGDEDLRFTLQSLDRLAEVQRRRSAFADAETAWRFLHDLTSRRFGAEQPLSLTFAQNLALALEKQGKLAEAESLYQLVLQHQPRDKVVLGNYAYMLQNVKGDAANAREIYLQALSLDPIDAINLNNYAGLCLMLEDFPEAEARLKAAWEASVQRLDRMAARTLFFRAALAVARGEPPALFLGQIKTITEAGLSPAPSENVAVMNHLRTAIPAAGFVLLDAVYAAINEPDGVARLNALPAWQAIRAVPLDTPWP
jgi:tetratricopeptide (TPR) repeat protein